MGLTRATEGTNPAAPIEPGARIPGLDALRGVALLGILVANVRQMFVPWDVAAFAFRGHTGDTLAWLDWGFFDVLIDLKFITLFSLLFGASFAIQSERLAPSQAGFAAVYLRRLALLALFGALHGLLLYPAEVLLPYAVAGLMLFALRGLGTDSLFRAGLVLVGSTIVWGFQLGSLGRISPTITLGTVVALTLVARLLWTRSWRLTLVATGLVIVAAMLALLLRWDPATWGESVASEHARAQLDYAALQQPDPSRWPAEYAARRRDDFGALLALHAGQYGLLLVFFGVILVWRTLGLFMLGAALLRSGAFTTASLATWRRVAAIGLGIGVPASAVATILQFREIQGLSDWRWPEWLHVFSTFPLAIGFAARVMVSERLGRRRWWYSRMESAGRMALSNYVGQSLVMAALAEPWGLGLYGRLGGPELTALAFVVFFALASLSHAWLARHVMGPLEWLWRCGTYGRWLPNRLTTTSGRQ